MEKSVQAPEDVHMGTLTCANTELGRAIDEFGTLLWHIGLQHFPNAITHARQRLLRQVAVGLRRRIRNKLQGILLGRLLDRIDAIDVEHGRARAVVCLSAVVGVDREGSHVHPADVVSKTKVIAVVGSVGVEPCRVLQMRVVVLRYCKCDADILGLARVVVWLASLLPLIDMRVVVVDPGLRC